MGPEDAEGGGGTVTQDATEESVSRLQPISTVNPQRPTERRKAVAMAKRAVAAPRQRRKTVAVAKRVVVAPRQHRKAAG